jgi:hypothetical protein
MPAICGSRDMIILLFLRRRESLDPFDKASSIHRRGRESAACEIAQCALLEIHESCRATPAVLICAHCARLRQFL